MTKDEDKLKKFLASDDPELVRMGIAMAKGMVVQVTAEMLDIPLKSNNAEIVESGVVLAKEEGIVDEVLKRLASEAGIVDEALSGPIPIHGGVLRITKDKEVIFNSWEEIDNLGEILCNYVELGYVWDIPKDCASKLEKIGWPAQKVVALKADTDEMPYTANDLAIEVIVNWLSTDVIWNNYEEPLRTSTRDSVVAKLGNILNNPDINDRVERIDWGIRWRCADYLESFGTREAIEWLIEGLKWDELVCRYSNASISTRCTEVLVSIYADKEIKPAIDLEELYSLIRQMEIRLYEYDDRSGTSYFVNSLRQIAKNGGFFEGFTPPHALKIIERLLSSEEFAEKNKKAADREKKIAEEFAEKNKKAADRQKKIEDWKCKEHAHWDEKPLDCDACKKGLKT